MQVSIVLTICGLGIASSNQRTYSQALPETDEMTLSKSLKLTRRLNKIMSINKVLDLVDQIPEHEKDVLLRNRRVRSPRFSKGERTSVVKAKPALCIPELQIVSFMREPGDSSLEYIPSCTRIKRCGGCCPPSLICEPQTSEIRNYEVTVRAIVSENISREYQQIVALEEHTSCNCVCEKKPQGCTEKQQYVAHECRCICADRNEEAQCYEKCNIKYWDSENCSCFCEEIEICSDGLEFDTNTCRCQLIRKREGERNHQ